MRKPAAIYARVSSDRQKENHTIASQTAALIQQAETQGYTVPSEWVFQDEGYSGANLVRPGLEALRDLAAQGHIEAVLVHSPDRLSRKYAYQILLAEEFHRQGVELIFLKAPSGATPEDQLVVQFQGMIAEYERAQIIERSRRGKRHRAQQGTINVLSGAPYGYRYVKKSDSATAYYEVIEVEAEVVRLVFDTYTKEGLSINAIARLMNERRIPTRTGSSRWERSTVWAMLRNPAYRGKACFGKTERAARKKITRPLRQRGGHSNRCGAHRERPRPEWIEIAVPALVSDATFALAQEHLEKNKRHSPRRTVAPSLLQGMLVCQQCGYALYRSSAQTSKQKLYYYRCIGSDAYRHLHGPVCTNRPIRQDYLDQFVWQEIIRVLEEPELIQAEIQRRLEAAQKSDPVRKREQSLRRELTRLETSTERLLTAYQESLLTLTELRRRMPELRKQQQVIQSELTSMELAASDQSRYLKLTHTLTEFRERLHAKSETMEVPERQRLLRLLVKEILVGTDTITVRHSLPIAGSEPPSGGTADGPRSPGAPFGKSSSASYLLSSGSPQPLLAKLFLHYAFDLWMGRNWSHLPFERYADDIIVHGRTEREANLVRAKIAARLKQCGLELHPEKTKLVYCKKANRQETHPHEKFDFLGYTFRPRKAYGRKGKIFCSFSPAISREAAQTCLDRQPGLLALWEHRRSRFLTIGAV